ncbi:MAG TPA: flavin-dependent oxidoreductase [Burkholderiales bacterium]|jgi:2-polyprenyl-6-methoxyphenol hydroxylase-like FAD-dependent oxidoreductase
MNIAIIGGGIAGLSFCLHLRQRGIASTVFEAAPEVRELGVGITLLPHAMREFAALGLEDAIRRIGIENRESRFFNRWGQFIYAERRGRFAGSPYPEFGVHRGKLHRLLYETAVARCGARAVVTNRQCVGVEQDDEGAVLLLRETTTGAALAPVRADIAVACDGVNSTVRRQFYPREKLAFAGINTWRGTSLHRRILDGRTYLRIGSIETGKLVVYPIVDHADGAGNQLINWMAEIRQPDAAMNDWNNSGRLEDFYGIYQDWRFDWLDVAGLIAGAQQVLEYPMVDRDPVARWTFGRVTLMGDAAHPMYPRGSNGAAQAIIDARTLADLLARNLGELLAGGKRPTEILKRYEAARLEPTARVVEMNRKFPPDYINTKVDELTGGKPFRSIDEVISQQALRAISDNYKKVAGFSADALGA